MTASDPLLTVGLAGIRRSWAAQNVPLIKAKRLLQSDHVRSEKVVECAPGDDDLTTSHCRM